MEIRLITQRKSKTKKKKRERNIKKATMHNSQKKEKTGKKEKNINFIIVMNIFSHS
jgi:hypothetical protein